MIFKQLVHLLPLARAWLVTIDKRLRQFLQGISDGLETDGPVQFYDDIYGDAFPATTRELARWEAEFGIQPNDALTVAERRTRLAGRWQALGGQSPAYIQGVLRASGFDVFVYDWWVPGTNTPRDPNTVITDPQKQLVNKIETLQVNFVEFGTEYQVGEPIAEVGGSDGTAYVSPTKPIPTDPATFPFFVYIGGDPFGTVANVPASRRSEFEALCLRLCPTQLWVGLIVDYV